jgi:hypothetical protein
MTLGTRYAADAPERLSINPGRTCGFAAEISVVRLPTSASARAERSEEDTAARSLTFGC